MKGFFKQGRVAEQNTIEILLVCGREKDMDSTLRAIKRNNLASKIVVIKDGEKALKFIFATGEYSYRDVSDLPKLIILDLKLPKVDGMEVLRKIKSDERTKRVPVVILTSSNEECVIAESSKPRAEGYIVKPMEFDDFAKTVTDIGNCWMQTHKSLGTN